jgi:hypothetical protein
MWGLKMLSFPTQKVLAEGKTSGCGGWVKKISRDNNVGANGLSMVDQQSKNNELDLQSLKIRGQIWILDFPTCAFPPIRIFCDTGNVGLLSIGILR